MKLKNYEKKETLYIRRWEKISKSCVLKNLIILKSRDINLISDFKYFNSISFFYLQKL